MGQRLPGFRGQPIPGAFCKRVPDFDESHAEPILQSKSHRQEKRHGVGQYLSGTFWLNRAVA